MIRSFAVAFATLAVVVLFGPADALIAQVQKTPPNHLPIDFSGGRPGVNLELFINNGKVAETAVNPQGAASSFLDFSNLGKVELHLDIDECRDGQTVKIMLQPGQAAEDTGCHRRFAGAGWWTDCGVTRITIDLTRFGAHVVGCGGFFTQPKGILTLVGIGGGGLIAGLAAGGGDQQTPFVTTPTTPTATTPTVSTAPTITVTPVTPTPTNSSTPAPPVTTTPFTFDIQNFFATYEHTTPGVSSTVCGSFLLNPVVAGAPWTLQTVGNGASQPTVTGTTNAAGVGIYRSIITQFNNYTINLSVTANGVTKTASTTVNVVSAAASRSCP